MKITTFNPLIVTSNPQPIIELFEALGFEKRHRILATESTHDKGIVSVRLKSPDGFYVDVAGVEGKDSPDLSLIRMNVDDFDEAYEFLTAHGFKSPTNRTVDTRSNKSAMMVSPSGFAFDLCQHIRDHE